MYFSRYSQVKYTVMRVLEAYKIWMPFFQSIPTIKYYVLNDSHGIPHVVHHACKGHENNHEKNNQKML